MEVREACAAYVVAAEQRVPQGYKQTEVGVIPEDWEVKPLEAFISALDAGVSVNSIEQNSGFYAHEAAILKTSCAIGGKFFPEESKTIDPRDIHRAKLCPRKDRIVISRMNTPVLVGECGYIDRDYPNLFFPDRLWMTRHDRQAEPCVQWLAYLLSSSSLNRALKESATGTSGSMKNISKTALLSVQIPAPPTKAEQEAIAEALSDADALIESLERLIAKERLIKQGTMQELLTCKRRLPGFSGEWATKRLGDIARIKTGSCNNQDKVEGGEYPFFVRSATVERINSYSYDCEAILIPGEGGIGNIFHYIHGQFDVHQRVYAITQFTTDVSGKYVYLYMTVHFGAHAMQNSVKATVDSLRLPTFHEFEIAFPPTKEEQTAIATILGDMDAELAALEDKLAKARSIKQGMMRELLTGRIRLV